MPAKILGYFDDWKTARLTCPKCGWSGTFEQGTVEHHEELMDSSCPVCPESDAPILAVVPFPTLAQEEANIDRLSDQGRASLAERKAFLKDLDKTRLKAHDHLPDLPGDMIVLSWDFREDPDGKSWTVIRHGDQVLWTERAVYEGAKRFAEVVAILKRRYGGRLKDVVPTGASGLYLYGDRLSSIDLVKRVRADLRSQ